MVFCPLKRVGFPAFCLYKKDTYWPHEQEILWEAVHVVSNESFNSRWLAFLPQSRSPLPQGSPFLLLASWTGYILNKILEHQKTIERCRIKREVRDSWGDDNSLYLFLVSLNTHLDFVLIVPCQSLPSHTWTERGVILWKIKPSTLSTLSFRDFLFFPTPVFIWSLQKIISDNLKHNHCLGPHE